MNERILAEIISEQFAKAIEWRHAYKVLTILAYSSMLIFLTAPCLLIAFYPSYIFYQVIAFFPSYMFYNCLCQNLTIFDHNHFCPKRGVPQTPTLRIPLKLQPKPRVLGFFDFYLN